MPSRRDWKAGAVALGLNCEAMPCTFLGRQSAKPWNLGAIHLLRTATSYFCKRTCVERIATFHGLRMQDFPGRPGHRGLTIAIQIAPLIRHSSNQGRAIFDAEGGRFCRAISRQHHSCQTFLVSSPRRRLPHAAEPWGHPCVTDCHKLFLQKNLR